DHLGIIFQQFNLLPYLSVLANVALPCRFSARRRARLSGSPETVARELVTALGLSERELGRPVSDLSVGQQQRVAVARALIGGPDLIIADEPTSALDHDNRDRFIDLLDAQRRRFGSSLLFVSHDATLASHFDRSVDMAELTRAPSEAAA
ncbi:MAG: ATP-binding cassette domain-containing protein, partial [Litorimonas sp.]